MAVWKTSSVLSLCICVVVSSLRCGASASPPMCPLQSPSLLHNLQPQCPLSVSDISALEVRLICPWLEEYLMRVLKCTSGSDVEGRPQMHVVVGEAVCAHVFLGGECLKLLEGQVGTSTRGAVREPQRFEARGAVRRVPLTTVVAPLTSVMHGFTCYHCKMRLPFPFPLQTFGKKMQNVFHFVSNDGLLVKTKMPKHGETPVQGSLLPNEILGSKTTYVEARPRTQDPGRTCGLEARVKEILKWDKEISLRDLICQGIGYL
ncbi:hypothetical protein Acr_16g0003270 [Actinidia rufa]|uniref:Secreted protein n=1 Tax=Actinidia rufa TaxID=165716 RepID=A0A7J0FYD7_9ERIC|nr:hypothetical protein Acr_16g0003270 [Actinidia rufa]